MKMRVLIMVMGMGVLCACSSPEVQSEEAKEECKVDSLLPPTEWEDTIYYQVE